ncbi:MAG TPA: CorA family divalent cation transporter [Chloroflexia bacterium]|nr:CorA family divalent cation transporter [Chloroflexia bacterium]
MTVRAYLFDADGQDQEVQVSESLISNLSQRHILWIDVEGHDEQELTEVGRLIHLHRQSLRNLLNPIGRPRLDIYGEYFQVNVVAIRQKDRHYEPLELDLFSGPNYVVTFHHEPIEFLNNFNEQIQGDTQIGQLNAASFLAALLDWHISSYFGVLDRLEDDVDDLDEVALLKPADRAFLRRLVDLRRRVSEVRQMLAPHREVFAALARPDFEAIAATESAAHFRALEDRLDRALDAVEHAREMIIGTFELFMTGTSQSTNETMKVLTVVTVLVGAMGVIAGIMGMNFQADFFSSGTEGFYAVLGGMIVLLVLILVIARWRKWF